MFQKFIFTLFILIPIFGGLANEVRDTVYVNENLQPVEESEIWFAFSFEGDSFLNNDTSYFYYPSGAIYAKQIVKHRIFKGHQIRYFENGIIKQKGDYIRTRKVGEHQFFDLNQDWIRTDYYNRFGNKKATFYGDGGEIILITECKHPASFNGSRNQASTFNEVGKYVNENLKRPAIADDFIDAFVTVHFYISDKGKIENLEITRSLHPILDAAVLQVFINMPNWKPARFNGKNWYSELTITVSY